jgi:hypothetical protein
VTRIVQLFRGLPTSARRIAVPAVALIVVACAGLASAAVAGQRAESVGALPDRLSDSAFWALSNQISEPGGYFRIEDNYTSNEMEIGQLYTMLRGRNVRGDVFIGVGPEQNFTYIAAIRPRMAFLIDIRRQAVMQHLMFKAMFGLSKDRGDFISILFGKPRPAGIDSSMSIQNMWNAYRPVASDSSLSAKNYARIVDRLTNVQKFVFTEHEMNQLRAVYNAFYYYGPSITTRGPPSGRGGDFMTLTAFSEDSTGVPQSFLATEDDFQYVKSLHDRNLIVPVSGDFAGPRAIRAIGAYLKEHGAVMRAFYVSNVEQYLFGDGVFKEFYANARALPVDERSVFIRPYSLRRWGRGPYTPWPDTGETRSLCPVAGFLRAAADGRVNSNADALNCNP